MNREIPQTESREIPSQYNELTIDLIRHGESPYKNIPPDLTETGIKQVTATANELARNFKPGERVIFWTSPAARAKGSGQIIREVLERNGANIIRQKEVGSVQPIKIRDLDFVLELYKEAAAAGNPDTVFMTHPEFAKPEHEKMETRPQVQTRIDRLLDYLTRIVDHVDFQDQPLRMVVVSHFELAEPIAKEVFAFDQAFQPGEDIRINMRKDRTTGLVEIYFDFRGEQKGPFGWDKDQRKLHQ